jgi:TM2 domain-containing membrane protein YozV
MAGTFVRVILRGVPGASKVVIVVPMVVAAGVVLVTCVLAADARRRPQAFAFLAGWLMPGLGHMILGKVAKGLFLFGLLALTYVFGLWLSGWHTVSFDDNPFYHVGMYGSGLTTTLGFMLGDPKAFPRDDIPKAWFDPGLLYVCVVGLLNVVMMLSLVDLKKPSAKPAAPAAEPAKVEEPAPAPATGEGAKA